MSLNADVLGVIHQFRVALFIKSRHDDYNKREKEAWRNSIHCDDCRVDMCDGHGGDFCEAFSIGQLCDCPLCRDGSPIFQEQL